MYALVNNNNHVNYYDAKIPKEPDLEKIGFIVADNVKLIS